MILVRKLHNSYTHVVERKLNLINSLRSEPIKNISWSKKITTATTPIIGLE